MWKFWVILAAALIAGGVYVVSATRKPAPAPAPSPAPATIEPRVAAAPPVPAPTPTPRPAPAETPAPSTSSPTAATETPALTTPAPAIPAPTTASSTTPDPAPAPTPKTEPYTDLIPTENATPDLTPPAPTPPSSTATPAPEDTTNWKKLGDFLIIPGKIEPQPDGSLRLDNRWTLKGQGTLESPYLVSWDLLISAEEAFDPQNGKKRLPERIAMLDGKTVRLNGYVAFPMTSQEPRELLSMLNQWDGCCIGTPPTPYDAVEVALTDVVEGDDRFATTGKVVGTFHVKPYLQGDWLIGLYVMEDAKLTPRDFGGAGAN